MSSLEGSLLVIGNPLLDIISHVPHDYLHKYDLKPGQFTLAGDSHMPIYDEIQKHPNVEYIAGGAAQNTARVAQWMIGTPGVTTYIGCIGKDATGAALKQTAEAAGVITKYLVDEDTVTGTCAVLVVNKERSLITNLAAAKMYKHDHIISPEIQQVVEKSKFIYSTGYFLSTSVESLVHLGEHCAANNKVFLFNLSAPFVIQFYGDGMASVLPFVDVVFSNEDEAKTLGEKQNWGTDVREIAQKLADWEKVNKQRPRTVIFTQGAHSTVVVHQGQTHEYVPIKIPNEEIVDLNGAGDSFVGGFLAGYVQGKSLEESVRAGHYAASEVIRKSGCTFPEKPSFHFK